MSSLRSKEGYFLLDNSQSKPLTDAEVHRAQLPPGTNAGRGVFEAPTYTCHRCNRVVVMHPLRTRERKFCRAHNDYMCDPCGADVAAIGHCKTIQQLIDEVYEAEAKGYQVIVPNDFRGELRNG